MSKKNTAGTEEREFITLKVSNVGFVVYGLGGGASRCIFEGQPLTIYLGEVGKKMIAVKDELNGLWKKLDRTNPENPENRPFIERCLSVGAWAFALARELTPFEKRCLDGPTNPLRSIYIERLEEIFTNCFAAAYIFGNMEERLVGRAGLLTDFEINGGIDRKTGGEGGGFWLSIFMYYIAQFRATDREPILYQRFGELMESLAHMITKTYPQLAPRLAREIKDLLESPQRGFGNKEVTSPAKTAMMEKLSGIMGALLKIKVKALREAEPVS